MSYSIVSFGGNVLPAVWPVKADTQEGALEEAKQMYASRVSVLPALLIDWDAKHVLRLMITNAGKKGVVFDNAGELFGIATTPQNFEEIAQVKESQGEEQE